MWEVFYTISRGRISVRYFSLFFASVLMALFLATIPAHSAYAEDAQRSDTGVTYANNTYAAIPENAAPQGLPQGTTGYQYLDSGANKAHFLLTTGDISKATSAQYVIYDFTPPSNFSNPSPPQTVTIAAASANQEPTSSCDGSTLSGIGWIVCPTVHFIAKSMDFIYGIVASFLEVKTVTADTSGPVYKLWSLVRDIANICFVLAFLLIVYSQITSLGISNFGIKKMLPRLIISAILMNVSYWICAFAVDASNLLGYSIHSMFTSLFNTLGAGGNFSGEIPTWEQVAGVALAGGGAIAAGVFIAANTVGGAVLLLIPILVAVAIAALIALTVLAARQALLMCLIIISPLAFVAFILPNTEKYFEKWRSTLTTLLLLFPIFSVIFSGAQLAGMAIIQTAGGSLITIILGMGVQVAPIVITPLLIKFSSGLVGKIAGMVNDKNKGLVDRTRNWAKGASQERKNKILADQNKFKGLNNSWLNPVGKGTRALDTNKRRREGRRKAYESMAESRYNATASGQRIRALNEDADTTKTKVDALYTRGEIGRQAIQRRQLADIDKGRADTEFEASHYGHRVDTEKREAERFKQTTHAQHEQSWNFRNDNDAASQGREMKLRIANDQAALSKLKVDTSYSELKLGESKALEALAASGIVDAASGKSLAVKLAEDAHSIAERSTLTTMRNNNATAELRTKINDAVLTDGAIYQLDSAGKKVEGADGKPIIISNRQIDGKSIRDYATGLGKAEITLANAVAEDRSDWGKQAQAAGELIAHFKLDSSAVQKLATKGTGTTFTVKDDTGNEFNFDASDEYVKEAAITKLFKEGSYSQKMDMLKETGAEIREVDAAGNVTVRQGYNYRHRSTVKSEAVSSGIGGLAPFINDLTYNEIIKGNFNGDDSMNMHAMRQIAEGRIKVDNLSGASDAALSVVANIGKLSKSTDPVDQAEFLRYKTMLFNLFAETYGGTSTPAYTKAVDNFNSNFGSNFDQTLTAFKQIIENTNLSRNTSVASRTVITDTLRDNGIVPRLP